jgi:hypothetical protein
LTTYAQRYQLEKIKFPNFERLSIKLPGVLDFGPAGL